MFQDLSTPECSSVALRTALLMLAGLGLGAGNVFVAYGWMGPVKVWPAS